MEELEELERRVPIASDKAIINLVNGIQINRELISYRKERGFFGQLFDQLAGTNRERQILLDGNLIAGQQALYDWTMELTTSLRVSQMALEVTQNSLLEARTAIRKQRESLSTQKRNLAVLDEKLDKLTHAVEAKIYDLEDRIRTLEVSVAAQRDFEKIVTTWEARLTYTGLPWPLQIVMLIKEVYSSSVAIYELQTRDRITYRQQLVNRILSANEIAPKSFFSLSELLDWAWQQAANLNDLELSIGVLETRALPYSRRQRLPLLFTINTTLELAVLPEDIRPPKPGRCAVEMCRIQVQDIDYTTTMHEFITQMTHETANDSLFLIANKNLR